MKKITIKGVIIKFDPGDTHDWYHLNQTTQIRTIGPDSILPIRRHEIVKCKRCGAECIVFPWNHDIEYEDQDGKNVDNDCGKYLAKIVLES